MHEREKGRRNIGIIALFVLGVRQSAIARLFGVSRQRVLQVVKAYRLR